MTVHRCEGCGAFEGQAHHDVCRFARRDAFTEGLKGLAAHESTPSPVSCDPEGVRVRGRCNRPECTCNAQTSIAVGASVPGVKHDAGKLDYSLVPWDGLEDVVRVLMFGAKKYDRHNWRKVPDSTERYRAALLRHVIAYAQGEENDPETGLPHVAHAVCCSLFLLGKREAP